MYKQLMVIVLLISLIFFVLFPGCQLSLTPEVGTGTMSGQFALPGSSFKNITGYTPIPGATVSIIDSEGNIHTTLTDENGFYSFDNITVKANTIINIEKDTEGGGKIVFMEVIPQALSPQENFYAGIADAESTALALVIEALLNLGQLQEEINLEEIISSLGFASLEEAIRQAQENNQDILTLSSIITQAGAIADSIVNPPTPALSSSKEITAYKFEASNNALSSDVTGTIDSTNHTVSLTVPYDIDVTSLIATFTLSVGATAQVGTTPQVSGTTPNDFTNPVTYTVTAEDSSTQDWVITVITTQPIRYVATNGDNSHDGSEDHPWKTIQYALDTIPTSGTIMVQDGNYEESIIFPIVKIITLKSVNGTYFASIIGDDDSATVTCSNCPEDTTLEGFTITHSLPDSGKGIEISGGNLIINNCIISNNSADNSGGGIYNKGTLTITESIISNNSVNDSGGGIYNSGTLTIIGSTISYNSANWYGGGIDNKDTLTITGSTILGNKAVVSGGGIYLHTETNVIIGGSSDIDIDNFNNFINNYKTGSAPSADQHIRNNSGDCHTDYPNNNFTPDS